MAEKLYQTWNGPAPTTASQAAVATGTGIKTMLQLSTPSTKGITIVEWGFSFDGSAAAAGIEVELLDTSVAATAGTASVAGDLLKLTAPSDEASLLTLGTGNTGYTFGTEGTPANVRMLDACFNQPTNYYIKQWPLGYGPVVLLSRFVRVRVKAAAAVNMLCYVTWAE